MVYMEFTTAVSLMRRHMVLSYFSDILHWCKIKKTSGIETNTILWNAQSKIHIYTWCTLCRMQHLGRDFIPKFSTMLNLEISYEARMVSLIEANHFDEMFTYSLSGPNVSILNWGFVLSVCYFSAFQEYTDKISRWMSVYMLK